MAKKIAIDWDDGELRLVAANCSGSSVKVTDVAVLPLGDKNVHQVLSEQSKQRGWAKHDTLVAIGRGKAELRELQLPAVPDEELPDMVRFQAIRSFASAGDSALVDYLVTNRDESGVEMIAAAIGPSKLKEVKEVCESATLNPVRIALRPLASAALFLAAGPSGRSEGQVILVDLLRDEAEIVIADSGSVIFVRTVRLPAQAAARSKSLAGELKRSLLACGAASDQRRVVLWGRKEVHEQDVAELAQATGLDVETLDPFTLVDLDRAASDQLTDHTGRLAPLVGLLVADELHADRLVDFLQPRKRPEPKSNRGRIAAMVGVPVALVLLLGFMVYRQFAGMDQEIERLQVANGKLQEQVEMADTSITEVGQVDLFLNGDVNWLTAMKRLAEEMPPAQDLIVREFHGASNTRTGGGTMTIRGGVTDSDLIEEFEDSIRDQVHSVMGDGATFDRTQPYYRYSFKEDIVVSPDFVQAGRYQAFEDLLNAAANQSAAGNSDSDGQTPADSNTVPQDSGDGAGGSDAGQEVTS
ncbi:type IV pilus biogenesis protein PilM [Crateriforma conspicua]|uniref:Competence protein A n=1 Tax=Crateriforma conspicua TaxID=2527996 RepID=A0A5C5Y3Q7_9PLAN|nr:hypothetical protein [Crateriforma conspicua]QDV64880.1 Competence protein A [Crateriforma conspicua]TWT70277.1 Competence protein A [Crateriforma conspicua]